MFVSDFRLKRLGMDQRSEEESMQSGEIMEKQGFGIRSTTRTRSRHARTDCDVVWRRVRAHDAYAWMENCQSMRTRTVRVCVDVRT